jgi:hypothetical protein
MIILEKIKTILFFMLKQEYLYYIVKNDKTFLNDEEIVEFTNNLLEIKEKTIIEDIFNKLEEKCSIEIYNKYEDKEDILEMMEEVLEDRELIINRMILEVKSHQKSKMSLNVTT